MRTSFWGVALLGAAVFTGSLQACGGAKKEAVDPSAVPTSSGPDTAGQPVTADAGQQAAVAVADAPSSTGGANAPAFDRPKMNDDAKASYLRAIDAFGRGDLQTAKALFTEAISKDPKAYQAHYSLGVILERLVDPDALSHYRQAFGIVADYEPALTSYALYLARRGNVAEADQFLAEKHGKFPKSAAITAALAEVKSIQRDPSAQQLAQDALKLNPNFAPAMVTLARDHYRNRRLDLAQFALQAILDGLGPDNPPRIKNEPDSIVAEAEARLLRALIFREEGKRSEAIAELERVVKMRPDIVDAAVQLGTYYLESGNAEKAQPLLERSIQYDRDNLVAHLNLGDCYRLLARPAESRREFEWVLAKDQAQTHVHYNLGLLYLFSADIPGMNPVQQAEAALQEFEKYKAQRNKNATTEGGDVEQLINQAKAKKALMEANAAAGTPATPPPSASAAARSASPASSAPATSAAPARSAAPAASAAPAKSAAPAASASSSAPAASGSSSPK